MILTRKEIWSVQKAWRKVFARRLHRFTGLWVVGRDGGVFQENVLRDYLSGVKAEAAYCDAKAEAVYIIDDDGRYGELRECPQGQKPSLSEFKETRDLLIFPPDFAWTVAVGAEVWDPVCFVRREWVDDVDSNEDEAEK